MKNKLAIGILLAVFICCFALATNFAQAQFVRKAEIPIPEANLNNGGTGNMISGVDLDKDGKTEIYLVNDNWNDTPTEVIPRIYKLELDGANWNVVWQAVAPVEKQNTWPALILGDLDKDGKQEIIWGVVNNLSGVTNLNPARILVYESTGDGSDVMGVSDGAGGYLPNSKWSITTEDNANIRITRFAIADPDGDGVDELIFSDRAGNTSGYYFGVASVDNIPDNGDGSETWTLETSGLDFSLKAGATENKWDVAVIGKNIYTFDEVEISKVSWNGSAWDYTALTPLLGGISFVSAQVVDLDKDGTQEILCGDYYYGETIRRVVLLQEEADTLKHTELARIGDTERIFGSACGDIDQDGYLDYVFGTRAGVPDGAVYRLAYRGGDITNPASYELTTIDSLYAAGSYTNVINITNLDTDPALEVLYTSSIPAGVFPNLGTQPIVVLDYNAPTTLEFDNLVVATEVLFNGAAPTGMLFKPGRILDNGNTIWFCGVNSSARETYVFRSIDGGKTFTHNAAAIPGRAAQMDAFDANTAVLANAEGKIYQTTDGGATWNEKYSYMISVIATGWFDGCRVLNENVAVAFGDFEPNGNMHFVRTADKGETWTEITGINFLNAAQAIYTYGTAACNVGESIWCCATNLESTASFVFRSYDAGLTWESFEIPTDVLGKFPRSITFIDDNNGMITDGSLGTVAKTTDGGATWTKTDNPDISSSSWVNGVIAIPNTNIIVAMDDIGVYYTSDLGATWGKMNTPAETDNDYFMSGIFLNKDFGYFFTYNKLVLRFENQVTGVAERPVENKPVDFHLGQNYPNPFNPTTTIAYTVPATEKVSLKVYNLMGAEIKTLVDGIVVAGSHSAIWDGTDNFGQKVTSGLYLYTLQIGNRQIAKRMVLVK